jgi:protein-disulfide isomerase
LEVQLVTKAETKSPGTETQPPNRGPSPLTLQFIVSIAAAVLVVAVAAGINHAWPIFGSSGGGGSNNTVSVALPTAQPTQANPVVQMDVGDAPTKGPKDAKVQIIEFSDFECPYCSKFVTDTMPQILQNYGDKVLFAFRNYPLPASMHPYAEKAAEAGECANDQGAFWQYHDLLFQNQSQLAALIQADATNGVTQVVAQLKTYAGQVGMDTTKFNDCLDSGADAAKVTSDASAMTDALTKASVTRFGTPSFFINGKFVSGAYPYDENSSGYQAGMFTFKAAIDEALAAAQ